MRLDINCDMGEGFGLYSFGQDEALLPYITSANIACGYHAGDPTIMRSTVQQCLAHQVAVGAHPGLPDREGFGRRKMDIDPQDIYSMTLYQIGALAAIVKAEGGTLHHVKAHGALYHMAVTDEAVAGAFIEAVCKVDDSLIIYAPEESEMMKEAGALGMQTFAEIFADRRYQADGRLVPRNHPAALITDPQEAADQIKRILMHGKVSALKIEADVSDSDPHQAFKRSSGGAQTADHMLKDSIVEIPLHGETVCIHGDGDRAVAFAAQLHRELTEQGIELATSHS